MLQRYIQILHDATDALTNLKAPNASALDYFTTVGYEFLVLFIGLAYIAIAALIIVIPVIACKKMNSHILKNSVWGRHVQDVKNYNKFANEYEKARKDSTKTGNLNDVFHLLNESEYTKIKKLKNNMKDNVPIFEPRNVYEMLNYIGCGYSKEIQNTKYADTFRPETYGNFDSFADIERQCIAKCIVVCTPMIIVYLMFIVPLIMLFIK